jgi:hypothetical protein
MSIGRECGCYSLEIILNTGVYILEDKGGGVILADVICGKNMKREREKGGKF